jgi:putative ABC transport system permease protein
MKTIALAFRYLWAKPLAAALNLLLLSLGLASMSFLLLVGDQLDKAFERDLAGIDVVVGAKGSPLQLILAGVFHLDAPSGNVPLKSIEALRAHPQVARVIPLSLGDSYQGFRIVGTTLDYPTHYKASLRSGAWWAAPMQAVLGSQVAARTGLKPGDQFEGSHGLGETGQVHGNTPYRVSGVMSATGGVLDRLILTATESVWQVHENATANDDEDKKIMQEERELTLALIQYKTPLAAVTFPRFVNTTTDIQAAAPAIEVSRLLRMLGVGIDVMRALAGVLLLTAALSVFIALWSAVRERRADLALLRLLGAPPVKLATLLLCEALWLALLATFIGILLGQALMAGLGWMLQLDQSVLLGAWSWPVSLWGVPLLALIVAGGAALAPAVGAYRVSVFELLK